MAFDNSKLSLKEIEALEYHYLLKYWYFLKFAEDDILKGLNTMNDIKADWDGKYGGSGGTSQFDVGCERIIYALLNGKVAGQPNSNPVSSDLFFEVDDAYIHIDLKSVTTSEGGDKDNIGDFSNSIFVGENQNSYKGHMLVRETEEREYIPNLPTYYTNIRTGDKKITLTYFVCLLNSSKTLKSELISIMCMPNGRLEEYYKHRPLKAGKNPGKTRFYFSKIPTFELLEGEKKRVRIVHKNPEMSGYVKQKLNFYLSNFDPSID
ncbi:hypothetical protein [Anaerovibrio sp. RM50]|uniref:hypothetical protein n=1 Tax=Anaerovibrio sp. RM50 TaxID=1200557 RepID=UPI000559E14C|nr:hypothetical protein [Anaerovibrio sp. RM50]